MSVFLAAMPPKTQTLFPRRGVAAPITAARGDCNVALPYTVSLLTNFRPECYPAIS
jgi:hypothetical protein